MVRLAVVTVLLALAAPSAARAADVSVANGMLRYAATPGAVSNVTFTETTTGTVQIAIGADDSDGLTALAGCTPGTPVVCTGVTSAAIDAGDGNDRITAGYRDADDAFIGLTSIPTVISGG